MSTHLCRHCINAEISSALQELTNMEPKELEDFHKKYQKKFKKVLSMNPGPATPLLPITAPANLITTPANKTALECLQNVEKVSQSTMAKNTAITRDGRRKLTQIYNKMRGKKKDNQSRKGRILRAYDTDGKGDARFEAAYELIFLEGYSAHKAAKQIVLAHPSKTRSGSPCVGLHIHACLFFCRTILLAHFVFC